MNNIDEPILSCSFCGSKFKPEERFNIDYKLVVWADHPNEPKSLNKLAKLAHNKCFDKFVELNLNSIVDFIINRLVEDNLTNDNIN